jgi:predicted dehydrogenase
VSNSTNRGPSRRDVMATTGKIAVASALAGVVVPHVHAAESNTIQVALVGCGGRGTGAAINALSVKNGPVKLVAMADVFTDRLENSLGTIKAERAKQVDVPEDRRFIGFDGYKKALDCLKPGDVAIFATPPAFRWVHFGYAISKDLNVFMEKPTAVDGPSAVKMMNLAAESVKKNLKVGVGLMCRHCEARGQQYDLIKSGKIGDLVLLRAYRMAGPTAKEASKPKDVLFPKSRYPEGVSDLEHQIRWFHSFLWASGGCYSDFLIHNIDECCWMKDAWPIKAQSSGGRHYRTDSKGVPYIDQNFDSYSTEFVFADGARLRLEGRTIFGCHNEFASYAHGTKGSAIISTSGHTPAYPQLFKGQNFTDENRIWKYESKDPAKYREPDPYQLEWDHLVEAIRKDKPYNEAKRGAEASLVTAMGRMSAHTGQVVTYEQILKHDHEFAPDVDKLVLNGPAPLVAGADGKYPVPQPGINKKREY